LYVAPKSPTGAQKRKGRFSYKSALRLKKVCYKVSLCENCQRQSCKAFIGLTISAKKGLMGTSPSIPEILGQSDRVGAKSPASAVTPSEKVQLTVTLIGSPLRAFQ